MDGRKRIIKHILTHYMNGIQIQIIMNLLQGTIE
jgi:hypothetical protein